MEAGDGPEGLAILLVGPPGSGKGTQAQLLVERLGVVHLSSGDLLREAARGETVTALELRRLLNSGMLVPDHVVMALLAERIEALREADATFVLDGFPRTVQQCQALEELLGENGIDLAIELVVPGWVLTRRVHTRGRDDDTLSVVARRQDTYFDETQPMMERLTASGLGVRVNGHLGIEAVHASILGPIERAAAARAKRPGAQPSYA
jgi:adenylate kinase